MTTQISASQEFEQRLTVLNRLVEISLVLNSTLDLDPLLRFIMDEAKDLVGAEAASILLKDKHTQELKFTASNSGGVSDLIGRPVPLEGSIAGTILLENRPVALDDVSKEPRHYRQMDKQIQFQTRSLLGVPMRIKEDVVGVLEVVNKLAGRWTADDLNTLSILAAQAAVAIETAQLVEALQKAYDELDQLDKLKNDFIAIASHELRTPLGVILGYASFLKEDSEGDASAHADAVFRSALQLRNIIEQMTNLRYLKLGETEITYEVVPLVELLATAENDIESLVQAKDHRLVMDAPDPTLMVRVDANKMLTALGNILNNAVKFMPPGGLIQVSTVLKQAEVWITIQDSGIGIAADQLEKIFDEFYQVENHLTRRHGGMGLGLSIARALVAAHGGRIWVESPGLGQGATFYICLPLASE
jgi:signal transduction histidine kinase